MTQLLFFDTFSHEDTDLYLDIVQFPTSVVVEEVRVIPLGSKVHVNFPGGMNMRLGATLPGKFNLELFVNDLTRRSSTFSSIGVLAYDHHGQICLSTVNRRVPTDGLVLRGHYNAVTLAVYGTPATPEQLAMMTTAVEPEAPPQPQPPPAASSKPAVTHSSNRRKEWGGSWPPPVSDSAARGNEADHYKGPPPPPRKEWPPSENGQRDEYFDPHHLPPPRHSSMHRHPSSSAGRPRSPQRESRSRTRSPSRRHSSNRRSVTPKSPPAPPPLPPSKNGYASPTEKKEDAPILDDVSDISDGDIPEDEEMPAAVAAESIGGAEPENDDDKKSVCQDDHEVNKFIISDHSKLPSKETLDIPEDMEEISDEEADWSDDGDFLLLEPFISCDVEFGPDWTDPVTVYKPEEHSLQRPKYYMPFVDQTLPQPSDKVDESLLKLADPKVDAGTSDWVECLETVEANSVSLSDSLLATIRRGLSFDEALRHPVHTFKVRHLKSSLKFTKAVLLVNHNWSQRDMNAILDSLMTLLLKKGVADPLRMQCLLALNTAMDHINGMNAFAESSWPAKMVTFLATKRLTTRVKVGVAAVLQRLSMIESLNKMKESTSGDGLAIVKQIITIMKTSESSALTFLDNDKCGVAQSFLKDLFNGQLPVHLVHLIEGLKIEGRLSDALDVLEEMFGQLIKQTSGLFFLSAFPAEVERLFELVSDMETRPFIEFVHYCLHALGKLDQLSYLCRANNHQRLLMESSEMLLAIKELYGMSFRDVGRKAIIHVSSLGEMLRPIISLVQHSGEVDEENQQRKDMKKSAIRGYACEILLLVVRLSDEVEYLHYFGDELLSLGKSDENSKLFELSTWLQWQSSSSTRLWAVDSVKVNDGAVSFLVATVKQHMDNISPMSNDLVMAIRFLHKLVVRQRDTSALLQVYSLDWCDHAISILNKICGYHEQPHLHTATFAGYNGHLLMAIIRMVVQLMMAIIKYRIACLDERFQDVSAVPTLLKTYTLCTVVSHRSESHLISLEACSDIIDLLHAYTAVPVDMSQEKTTAWQSMLSDLVQYTLTSPHTYLPGLKLMTEVLPRPLAKGFKDLSPSVVQQRNLWSAQLYGMETQIKSLIEILMPCKVGRLQQLLFDACHQIADLSAPTAVIVADAILRSLGCGNEASKNGIQMLQGSQVIKTAFLSLLQDSSERLKSAPTLVSGQLASALLDPRTGLEGEIDFNDLQGAANALPDRENSIVLINAALRCDKHFVSVAQHLTRTLLGTYLLRGCLLRHKEEFSQKLQALDAENMEIMSKVLKDLAKYTSQSEMRELSNWTDDTCDSFAAPLVEILSGPNYKVEELEIEWPAMTPLLEQFAHRCGDSRLPLIPVSDPELDDLEESGVDLVEFIGSALPMDFDILQHVKQVCDEKSLESEKQKKKAAKKSLLESKALANKSLISSFKAGRTVSIRGGRSVFNRGPGGQRSDMFRSRPPNTSRPPSLHVDDFLVLQSRGQQPTGPTGYNKQSLRAAQELFAEKEAKSKGSVVGFREATKEPVFDNSSQPQSINEVQPRSRPERPIMNKGYRNNASGNNGRALNRDRYGDRGATSSSRGWSHSPNRDNRSSSARSAPDHRFINRRSGKNSDNRRGAGKERNKGNKRGERNMGSVRSIPR